MSIYSYAVYKRNIRLEKEEEEEKRKEEMEK